MGPNLWIRFERSTAWRTTHENRRKAVLLLVEQRRSASERVCAMYAMLVSNRIARTQLLWLTAKLLIEHEAPQRLAQLGWDMRRRKDFLYQFILVLIV